MIAILPEPNKERLIFESIDPYIPVLGETPATDGIPSVRDFIEPTLLVPEKRISDLPPD
jgi:hypothetical protein